MNITILVTGWESLVSDKLGENVIDSMRKAYRQRETENLIVFDAGRFVNSLYRWATLNALWVGEVLGNALVYLSKKVNNPRIHLIGHSVGATIVGVAGRRYHGSTGEYISRITGLDPAIIARYLPTKFHKILFSYLQGRTFKVKYKDALSRKYLIKAGVPQGSVLGPILYLLYTFDLPTCAKILTATFADDTAIIFSHINPQTASRVLQELTNKILDWADKWKIKINQAKTQQITFTLS